MALLQESRPGWLDVVCRAAGLSGVSSLDVDPKLAGRRRDGCAVAVRSPLRIERAWRMEPGVFEPAAVADAIDDPVPAGYEVLPAALATRFSTRTLLAEVSGGDRPFVAAALHATPGMGRVDGHLVSEWKPFFHGAAAVALAALVLPFVFAVDRTSRGRNPWTACGFTGPTDGPVQRSSRRCSGCHHCIGPATCNVS